MISPPGVERATAEPRTAGGGEGAGALLALGRREIVRFFRQPSRIFATIATPALLWLFLASGFAESFAPPRGAGAGQSYAAFLLPGVATAVVVFSAIFASLSLIEDRRAGFLQSALVSPAPGWAMVGAKTFGGAAVATLQSAVIIGAAPVVGLRPGVGGFALALLAVALAAVAVTAVGLTAAWWVNSSEGFHGVMNLLLMPMWLLSGAFFPAEGAAGWLAVVMLANPLRWSTDALRWSLGGGPAEAAWSWVGTALFAAGSVALAAMVMGRARPARMS